MSCGYRCTGPPPSPDRRGCPARLNVAHCQGISYIAEPMLEASVPAPLAVRGRLAAFVELTKPGIVRMVLITAGAGFVLAAGTAMDVVLLLHTLIGMGLVASGSCGLNQYMERDADARMRRTASRPIPSGRVSPLGAAVFSSVLSLAGLVYLSLYVGPWTTWLTLLS